MAAPSPRGRLAPLAAATALLAAAAVLEAPPWWRNVKLAFDPGAFNDDARIWVHPFFEWGDRAGASADIFTRYVRALSPVGYGSLYDVACFLRAAVPLSKALPYVLMALVLAALGAAAHRLAGRVAMPIAIAFTSGVSLFPELMIGGTPRSFAFPLVALAALALVAGRARLLGALVVSGAAFYPAGAAPIGLALAASMLLPSRDRGDAAGWSPTKRAGFVAAVLSVSAALAVPTLLATREFGSAIGPPPQEAFPEAGPGGRYDALNLPPAVPLPAAILRVARSTLLGPGGGWIPAARALAAESERGLPRPASNPSTVVMLLVLGALALLAIRRRHAPTTRLAMLLVGSCAGYVVADVAAPYLYLPERYVAYPIPVLVVLGVAALPAVAAEGLAGRKGPIVSGLVLASLVPVFFSSIDEGAGYVVRIDTSAPVYRAIAALPPDALLAGWPNGVIENVPYVTRRRVLLSEELHQAFHAGFLLEARRRMNALIDAYWAPDPAPVERLVDDLGVTHFLLDGSIARAGAPPGYFRPFGESARAAVERRGNATPYLLETDPACTVWSDGNLHLVDLRCVTGRSGRGPRGPGPPPVGTTARPW